MLNRPINFQNYRGLLPKPSKTTGKYSPQTTLPVSPYFISTGTTDLLFRQ